MATQNLFIASGMYFGVTDIPKADNENQQFSVNLNDNRPDRVIVYTSYDTWLQTEGSYAGLAYRIIRTGD
ncbi:hypothetical protein HDF19_10855 [Mucilaginibacter sp. E4BP6]|uniref:hypothetical protein n=1 Tax=Mucilaginibacter sp. E4BP6 TaxID=2723089 RepID=UPI0015C8EF42|nr:hypothetical protein [Mucilaginibacter sp. E4BP6]NYE65346.1 hypothetical protein [Mucilaginibacter sp. E4BP6]